MMRTSRGEDPRPVRTPSPHAGIPRLLLLLLLALGPRAEADHCPCLPCYPDPEFVGEVTLDRTRVHLGESFTVTATVTNASPSLDCAGSGSIVVSFPPFDGEGDDTHVQAERVAWRKGAAYLETTAGSAISTYDGCGSLQARYLSTEYVDPLWSGGETHTMTLKVTPDREGTFVLDVRAWMYWLSDGGCTTGKALLPPNGAGEFVDQQGGPVKRFEILVEPAVPVEPVTWGGIKSRHAAPRNPTP